MSQFVKKASSKIEKLSNEEILRIIETQTNDLKIRNYILDNSIEGSLMLDGSDNVIYLNATLTNLITLYPRKKYTDVNVSKVIADSDMVAFIRKFRKSGKDTMEEYFQVSDPVHGQRAVICIASRVSEIKALLFVFRDMTFFNRFKEEFRKNESLAQMTTMAAGVAHEIKNPLASISIYLQLMDKMMEKNGSMTREEAKKYLDVVSEEVDRINKIAVDFLFAVKPMKVNLAICNVNDIVKKTVSVVSAELKEKGIAFKQHLAVSLPKVLADSSLIQQSILNLINNAMQAMPEDRKDPAITVSTFMENDMVKISVADNGCGMSEEQMSKIFEPYYTTKSSGTGLGLTVLFKIMKQHEGDVTVSSTPGVGSEFTLQIPVPSSERFRLTDDGRA
jgi:signal transduction histidine kinase